MFSVSNFLSIMNITVFAGDLSYFCTEDDLAEVFSHYGSVQRAIIRRSKEGQSLNYGFVTFHRVDDLDRLQELEGMLFLGRYLR